MLKDTVRLITRAAAATGCMMSLLLGVAHAEPFVDNRVSFIRPAPELTMLAVALEPLFACWFGIVLIAVRNSSSLKRDWLFFSAILATGVAFNRTIAALSSESVSLTLVTIDVSIVLILFGSFLSRAATDADTPTGDRGHPVRYAAAAAALLAATVTGWWMHARDVEQETKANTPSRAEIEAWWAEQRRAAPTAPARPIVELVTFSDYQCPACRHASEQRAQVSDYLARHSVRVSFVDRDYPLDASCNPYVAVTLHVAACEAAVAMRVVPEPARAALRAWLYKHQKTVTSAQVVETALRVSSITSDHYQQARRDVLPLIAADIEEAHRNKVEGTPTLFVNGVRLGGSVAAPVLQAVLEIESRRK